MKNELSTLQKQIARFEKKQQESKNCITSLKDELETNKKTLEKFRNYE